MEDQPAAERAYRSLKSQILAGKVRGGDLLSEVEIGGALGISRTPVHEAFLRLQAEDLLVLKPRRGAVVVPVKPGEATDLLEVRRALETAAVRRLGGSSSTALTARSKLHSALDALLTKQERIALDGDVSAFASADEQFHRSIVAASGNAISIRFYSTLGDRQRRMAMRSIGARTDHLGTLVSEHRHLAQLMLIGDVGGFDEALTRHLSATHAALLGGSL